MSFIAAAGVMINDSLVMTDYVNKVRREGLSIKEAVVEVGCARFRAILRTSITTFVGGLGFAVLFATVLTLVLCLYLMLADVKHLLAKMG